MGLDVSFLEHQSGTSITDNILNENADYGVGYSSIIADYHVDKPIVMLANFFKQSPLVLVTQKDIKTPSDLMGKKIMGISDSIDNITLLGMLSKFNLHDNDYENVATNFKIDAFVEKKVDAMTVFTTNEVYYLDKRGVRYNIFNPVVYGVEYYDCNLFTSKEEFLKHPKRAKNFTDASIRGWEYALSHKEEMIAIILKKYNSQHKSREALMFEAKQTEAIMLPKVFPIGSIDMARIELIINDFKQAGYINENIDKDLSKFVVMNSNQANEQWNFKSINYDIILIILLFLILGLIIVLIKNWAINKLNKELQQRVNEAIKETQEKDKIIFHQNKLTSMGEMMENIAHQWRQPLAQINSAVLLLDDLIYAQGTKNAEIENKLTEIEDLTMYMSKTISDFRDYHTPNREKSNFFLHDNIIQAIKIVDISLLHDNIEVNILCREKYKYKGYKNELKQVLIVLLNNARDALKQNSIKDAKIEVKVTKDIDTIYITVCDNAKGIKEEHLDRIFEPYFSTKHKSQGAGLGLYLAKMIIQESFNGLLNVYNTQEGACFEIRLKV